MLKIYGLEGDKTVTTRKFHGYKYIPAVYPDGRLIKISFIHF